MKMLDTSEETYSRSIVERLRECSWSEAVHSEISLKVTYDQVLLFERVSNLVLRRCRVPIECAPVAQDS